MAGRRWHLRAVPPKTAAIAWALSLLLLGCNLLTGADDLRAGRDDDDDDVQHTTSETVPAGGGGGAGNTAVGAGGTQAGGQAPTGGQGTGAGPSQGGTGQGGTGAGPTECMWPPGPYGIDVGQTLPEALSWQGYRAHSSAVEVISITEYFDCDGSQGIHAVLLSSQSWYCGACQVEASELEGQWPHWDTLGIKASVMLLEGSNNSGATASDAMQWKMQWGLESMAVVADPNLSLLSYNNGGVPQATVVDPRTMQVIHVESGYSGSYAALLSIASQNGP